MHPSQKLNIAGRDAKWLLPNAFDTKRDYRDEREIYNNFMSEDARETRYT